MVGVGVGEDVVVVVAPVVAPVVVAPVVVVPVVDAEWEGREDVWSR